MSGWQVDQNYGGKWAQKRNKNYPYFRPAAVLQKNNHHYHFRQAAVELDWAREEKVMNADPAMVKYPCLCDL